jgi:chemotaxis signal transduction protein
VTATPDLHTHLAQLKQRFDGAFAAPPEAAPAPHEDLLAVRFGGERHCLRLREIDGMFLERAITPLPSSSPHVLGAADFRGELVAVYDLSTLLGGARAVQPRYLVRSRQRQLAFAFERFDGHLRVQQAQATAHAIIDLNALVARLERGALT